MSDLPRVSSPPPGDMLQLTTNTEEDDSMTTSISESKVKPTSYISSLSSFFDGPAPPPGRRIISNDGSSASIVSTQGPADAVSILKETAYGSTEKEAVSLIRESLGETGDDEGDRDGNGDSSSNLHHTISAPEILGELTDISRIDLFANWLALEKAVGYSHREPNPKADERPLVRNKYSVNEIPCGPCKKFGTNVGGCEGNAPCGKCKARGLTSAECRGGAEGAGRGGKGKAKRKGNGKEEINKDV